MAFWSTNETPLLGDKVPEKRLLAAVLQRAITDYLESEGEFFESTRAWLMDDEPTDAPFSFHFICEALDLDISSLRNAIKFQAESGSRNCASQQASL